MAGTKAGGRKAAATNKERHGKDFYSKIGSAGFYANRELARTAGAKGGKISRRGKVLSAYEKARETYERGRTN